MKGVHVWKNGYEKDEGITVPEAYKRHVILGHD